MRVISWVFSDVIIIMGVLWRHDYHGCYLTSWLSWVSSHLCLITLVVMKRIYTKAPGILPNWCTFGQYQCLPSRFLPWYESIKFNHTDLCHYMNQPDLECRSLLISVIANVSSTPPGKTAGTPVAPPGDQINQKQTWWAIIKQTLTLLCREKLSRFSR